MNMFWTCYTYMNIRHIYTYMQYDYTNMRIELLWNIKIMEFSLQTLIDLGGIIQHPSKFYVLLICKTK